MASTFNADQFLQTRQTGAMETKYPVCPAGEYRGCVDGLKVREMEIKKGDRKGDIVTVLDIVWEILDERVKELLQMKKVTARQSCFLDLTPEGQLDLGKAKNVNLGRVREALGQNDPNKDWFPNMLLGAIAKVNVEHSPSDDPETPYANIKSIAPID